jgi:CBS domain-containing protein
MKIRDVMTCDVITVPPQASLKDAAGLLVDNRISGLPVLGGDGTVLGILSEGDLIYKANGEDAGERGRLTRLVDHHATAGQVKHDARVAGEAMTAPAQTIAPSRPVAAAAAAMIEHNINRLPVVEDGVLVGIVTRADLVRAFVRSDEEIAEEISRDIVGRALWLDEQSVHVEVANGEVTLSGSLDSHGDAELLPILVAKVPGVVGVSSKLTWVDDLEG